MNHAFPKNFTGRLCSCALLAFLPALLFLVWILIMKLSGSPFRPAPAASDEMFWYHQVSAMVDSGRPLGYFGYNGTHAPIGTFGPWGIAILIPYAIFGKIFGWGIYSMCIANVTILGIGLFSFAFTARLSDKELSYTVIAYCCILMNLFYSVSSMAEPLRWALAMFLTGCMIRLYRGYAGPVFRYLIMPLILFYCTQAYMLLALFIPVYLLLILPVRNLAARTVLSAGITGILAVFLRKLLFLVVSPLYVISTEPVSITQKLSDKLQSAFGVLYQLSPPGLYENRGTSFGFLSLFFAFFTVLLILTLILTLQKRKDHECLLPLFALYLLAGALGGYCLIYHDPSFRTLGRGLNTAFTCAILLLALLKNRKITALCLIMAVISLPSFYRMSQNNLKTRYLSDDQLQLMEDAGEEFAQLFDISEEHSTWENTIAQYGVRKAGRQTALTLAMPRSAGYNCMLNNELVCDAGYALVFNSYDTREQYEIVLSRLEENGYQKIYIHKALTLFRRIASSSQ